MFECLPKMLKSNCLSHRSASLFSQCITQCLRCLAGRRKVLTNSVFSGQRHLRLPSLWESSKTYITHKMIRAQHDSWDGAQEKIKNSPVNFLHTRAHDARLSICSGRPAMIPQNTKHRQNQPLSLKWKINKVWKLVEKFEDKCTSLLSIVICPWPGSGECCLRISEMNKTMTRMSDHEI